MEGSADVLVNQYIPLRGCPASALPDNSLQLCSKLALTVYKLLGMRRIASAPSCHSLCKQCKACEISRLLQAGPRRVRAFGQEDNFDRHLRNRVGPRRDAYESPPPPPFDHL